MNKSEIKILEGVACNGHLCDDRVTHLPSLRNFTFPRPPKVAVDQSDFDAIRMVDDEPRGAVETSKFWCKTFPYLILQQMGKIGKLKSEEVAFFPSNAP